MSSNSPVLLLAPTAVPTGPVLTPMLLTKMDARTLMSSQPPAKPAEVTASKAAESPSTNALTSMTAIVTATPTASKATATVAAKVSLSANAAPIVGPVTVPAATAASSIPAPAMSPVSHVTSLVTPLSIQSPSSRLSAAMASSAPVTRPASISYTTPKRGAASIAAPPSPMSPPDSPSGSGASSPSSAASPKGGKSHTGRWTEAEHKLFLKGLEQFPYRAWKKIATLIKTRTVVQIRTHAQKYYQKLEKEEQRMREREAQLAAQQGTASVVSTPRAEPMSAPSTPAATPMSDLTPAASAFSLSATAVGSAADVTGAIGKRKAPLRKRKGSSDDEDELMPPSSLPKRMMKEKKFVREKTMSPKQKTAVAGSRVFNFGDGSSLSSDSSKSSSNSLRGFNAHPLDFDDADDVGTSASSMILDFAEEKPIVEYPFALDSALEHGLAGIDQDELLQLSDDENMEWFSSSTKDDVDEEQEEKESGDLLGSSPLEAFSPLYSEDCLQFVDPAPRASQVTTPSPILTSSPDFELSDDEHEEDDDFVLDPEKFLSSYFQPDNAASPKSA